MQTRSCSTLPDGTKYRAEYGVIRQVDPEPILYDEEYVALRSYGGAGLIMSHIRLSVIEACCSGSPESLMDVGYGAGEFLSLARERVSECFGYDVTPCAPPAGVTRAGSLSTYADVVTMFDSLEHMVDPDEALDRLRCRMLVVSVPWCHWTNPKLAGFKRWKHRRPNEHLWHFTKDGLIRTVERHGFHLLTVGSWEDQIRGTLTVRDGQTTNILSAVFSKA